MTKYYDMWYESDYIYMLHDTLDIVALASSFSGLINKACIVNGVWTRPWRWYFDSTLLITGVRRSRITASDVTPCASLCSRRIIMTCIIWSLSRWPDCKFATQEFLVIREIQQDIRPRRHTRYPILLANSRLRSVVHQHTSMELVGFQLCDAL